MLTIRLSGYTPNTETQPFFASAFSTAGVADAVSNTASATATTPSGFSSPMFVNFVTVPEPSTVAFIGAAGVAGLMMVRRRRG